MDSSNQVPENIRARIIEVAEALYAESGFERLPSVSHVRNIAKCDMNAASAIVREWKAQLSVKAAPVAVVVPEAVAKVFNEVLGAAWSAAQDLANESLRVAQASWEKERKDLDGMRAELASLYDELSNQLDDEKRENALLIRAQDKSQADIKMLEQQVSQLHSESAAQSARADQAEARAEEIQHRADDLKAELAIAHDDTNAVRNELSEARLSHVTEVAQLNKVSSAEIEKARAALATLQGRSDEAIAGKAQQVETLQEQVESLGQRLADSQTKLATLSAQVEAAKEARKNAGAEALRQAERFTHLQGERDDAVREASHLGGQLEAVQRQNSELMAKIKLS
jgi:colicin import membrane protein